jgi:hypothetical protein
MQLRGDRPINPQKYLDFVKRCDAFFSSLAATKTKKVRIAHKMYFYFYTTKPHCAMRRICRCESGAILSRAPATPKLSAISSKTSTRGAPSVKPYRCARAPARHRPSPGRRNAPPDDRLLRVIQYSRDISD